MIDAEDEDDGADGQADAAEDAAEAGKVFLQRGLFFFVVFEEAGDRADLGVHASGDDDAATAAVSDGGTHEGHAAPLGEGGFGRQGGRVLVDRHRFAGERGFFDFEVDGFDEPEVGRHEVAGFEEDDVAGNELAGGYRYDSAVP